MTQEHVQVIATENSVSTSKLESWGYRVAVCMILRLAVEHWLVTDKQADRQRHNDS